jgi:preprotein translocase subunit SecE
MTENAVEGKTSRRRRREAAIAEAETSTVETDGAVTVGKGRATPGRRNQEEEKEEGNIVTRSTGGLFEYFADVRQELEKVSWPTREDAFRLTRVVLIVLVISALVLGGMSFLFQQFVAFGLANPIVFVLLLAVVTGIAVYMFFGRSSTRSGY